MSRHFPASSYLGQRVLVQWSAMLMLSTVFAPRFTPAVARSRAHRRWKYCVVWWLRQWCTRCGHGCVTVCRAALYPGGRQSQGAQALEVLRGLVFAPVMHAVQAGVSERLLALLNGGAVPEVKSAVIANAQSKVLIVEFHQPIAARVLE